MDVSADTRGSSSAAAAKRPRTAAPADKPVGDGGPGDKPVGDGGPADVGAVESPAKKRRLRVSRNYPSEQVRYQQGAEHGIKQPSTCHGDGARRLRRGTTLQRRTHGVTQVQGPLER